MLDAVGGGAGFAGVSDAVSSLQKAASGGGFSISEEGGQKLLDAINTLSGKIGMHLAKSRSLTTRLPLGSSPAAQVYIPFLTTVASDPTQGVIPVLEKLKADLEAARTTIQQSIANSRDTDQGNSQQLKTSGTIIT
jgi:hypothetical protein